jgi:transposase-like protein
MGIVLRDRAGGRDGGATFDAQTWVDREIAGCEFSDARLGKRFRMLLERIGSNIGQSIPLVVSIRGRPRDCRVRA